MKPTRASLAGTVLAVVVFGGVVLTPGREAPAQGRRPAELVVTHAVASGDVSATSAVIWARTSGRAQMHVEVSRDSDFRHRRSGGTAAALDETDFTAHLKLEHLEPDTVYYYRMWFSGSGGPSERVVGQFRTAPAPWMGRPVSFVVGGDLGGDRFCRNESFGYIIFNRMAAVSPDFFIANGDMIYADHACPTLGPKFPGGPGGSFIDWKNVPGDFPPVTDASVDWTNIEQLREVYWRHWRYNRADTHVQGFLREVPMYSQWDNHEVIGAFGSAWASTPVAPSREGFPNLVAAGRDAFFHYSPIDRSPDEPNRIYRSFRWGRDLEVFFLDQRSYRSRDDLADVPENAKTMLGEAQLEWLKQGLIDSSATWKVVSLTSPLSVRSSDDWANGASPFGFERELLELLGFLDEHRVRNLVFVVADLHAAANIRYAVDLNGDGVPLVFYELISGPLSARPSGVPRPEWLDATLAPHLIYPIGGTYPDGVTFNFGYVRIREDPTDGAAHLIYESRRSRDGATRPGSRVDLKPE